MKRLLLLAAVAGFAHGGEPATGEAVYSRCMGCHAFEYHRTGPKHCGLFGRRAGSAPDFSYSPAMKGSRIVWNESSLERFIAAPTETVPGTTMTYAGVPDRAQRAALIAYLREEGAKPRCK